MEEASNVQPMDTAQSPGAESPQQEQQQPAGGQKKQEQGQEQGGGSQDKGLLGTIIDLVKDMMGVGGGGQQQGQSSGQQMGGGEMQQEQGQAQGSSISSSISITASGQDASVSLSQETANGILKDTQLDFGGSSPASPADGATAKSPDAGAGVQQGGQDQGMAM